MMKNHLPTLLGALVISTVLAAPANAQGANAQGIESKLQVCGSCHGENGVPIDPKTIPIIWGQTEYFIVKQMHDFKTGDRESPIMSTFAKQFTPADLRPLARYFSAKQWPAKTATVAATPPPANVNIAVCQICHQQGFVGGLPAPRLAGQSYEFLIGAMNSFANGTRTNNADMVKLMEGLSVQDREAIAHYIAGL